ncbi:MAG: DNA (cytosine-5-)-methyltransferase [Candidatus Margulisbacteria bacterium]|nr:DNA (cytosine-5-)-methyltransferase [Candidatus Margulisiibacteriota bacterium]
MQKTKKKKTIKFMDFCAGIGAGRLGLEKNGMRCVGFSEINKSSEKTYREFFGHEEQNFGDLMKADPKEMPDFDLMIAGFPCQTFSIVGQRKGMADDRGQIIFGLIKIMLEKNLKYFILENVKGLVNHDKGRTLRIILDELDKAGYKVIFNEVLNSEHYGVPQMRERIYFVGIRKDLVKNNDFGFIDIPDNPKLSEYLIDNDASFEFNEDNPAFKTFIKYLNNKYNKNKYNLEDILKKNYTVLDTRQSDLRIYKNRVPTLRTGRHGILYVKNGKLRRLSGYESLLLQGFPKDIASKAKNKINNTHLLSQAGNAMTVNVIERLAQNLLTII